MSFKDEGYFDKRPNGLTGEPAMTDNIPVNECVHKFVDIQYKGKSVASVCDLCGLSFPAFYTPPVNEHKDKGAGYTHHDNDDCVNEPNELDQQLIEILGYDDWKYTDKPHKIEALIAKEVEKALLEVPYCTHSSCKAREHIVATIAQTRRLSNNE